MCGGILLYADMREDVVDKKRKMFVADSRRTIVEEMLDEALDESLSASSSLNCLLYGRLFSASWVFLVILQ